ncbi:diadenylate cyclase CdaA [Desulfonatronum lacustre]|uniref:diadenylate cyclase CdaA n=1 Tax=Desulfonatronum lacustre TaxID=66849 RepID=UPI00048FA972|nr:diadenylate cyclase CdaA [Desulfonatronum lacustre]SMP68032.1 TIGR00159 family protein [Desulfonatronum zhilinae]
MLEMPINIPISIRDMVDIGLVTFAFYRLILLVKGTRAVSVIYGLVLILVIFYLSDEFGLFTLNWLLANFLGSLFLVIIIFFQQDIRKALSELGAGSLWRRRKVSDQLVNEVVFAALNMAKSRIGALIVLERGVPLGDIIARGVEIKADLTRELLVTIFYPNTPLHDGAVVVRGGRIEAAGCILPLSSGVDHSAKLGTRHRAAIGVSEETDAVALVVSEERGIISIAQGGRLTEDLSEAQLKDMLREVLEQS